MASNYSLICDLKADRVDWSIQLRLTRKWESHSFKANNELISMDVILVDKNGDHIHASIKKYLLPRFSNLLHEGKVYTVTNFKVSEAKMYRPVSNHYMISFLPSTTLKLEKGDFEIIPQHRFEFVQFEDLRSRLDNDRQLTDVIGSLTEIGEIEDQPAKGSILKKRRLELKGINGNKVKITLWAERALQIDDNCRLDDSKPLIAIVTSTMVRMYKGDVCLTSSPATKLYINPNIPEVLDFMNSKPVEELAIAKPINKPVEEKTILDILTARADSDSEEIMVMCNASIIAIDTKNGWYYVSCKKCFKKLTKKESSYYCDRCNTDEPFPKLRYKLQVHVKDETAETSFVIFDREAEKILGKPISEIYNSNLKDDLQDGVPETLNKIVGKKYSFQLKLTKFNLRLGCENYTVTKIANIETKHAEEKTDDEAYEFTQTDDTLDQASQHGKYTVSPIRKRNEPSSKKDDNDKQAKKQHLNE